MSDAEKAWRHAAYLRYGPFLKYATPALQKIDPAGIAYVDPHEYDPEAVRILWAIESGICPATKNAVTVHLQRIFEDLFYFGQVLKPNVDWRASTSRIIRAWHRYRRQRDPDLFAKPCAVCEAARLPADHPAMLGPQDFKGDWLGVTYEPCEACGRLRVHAVHRSEPECQSPIKVIDIPLTESADSKILHEDECCQVVEVNDDIQIVFFKNERGRKRCWKKLVRGEWNK